MHVESQDRGPGELDEVQRSPHHQPDGANSAERRGDGSSDGEIAVERERSRKITLAVAQFSPGDQGELEAHPRDGPLRAEDNVLSVARFVAREQMFF